MFSFENISWTINNRTILKNISSKIRTNKLTAIMGGSGAGKTSLFKILSGRTATKYSGKISINSVPIKKEDMINLSGYVYQADILPENEYVYEYLEFVSKLKDSHVDINKLIEILGLQDVKNSLIGDANSGISGGQKKRLSIAVELISNPEILFLDEPTSGLDVFSATKLIKYLKKIKKTCIVTIHQPSTEIFNTFDDLIVLKDTKIFYKGTTQDFVPYLKKEGFFIPESTNPADYLFTHVLPCIRFNDGEWERLNKVDMDDLDSEVTENERKIERLIVHVDETPFIEEYVIATGNVKSTNFLKEFILLLKRYLLNIKRDSFLGILRFIEIIVFVSTIGPVFYNAAKMDSSVIHETTRGFYYTIINNIFWGASFNCFELFFYDKLLFIKEFRSGLYHPLSYYAAKTVCSIFFCTIGPLIFSPIFIFLSGIKYTPGQWLTFIFSVYLCALLSHSLGILGCCIFPSSQITLLIFPMVVLPLSTVSGMVCPPSKMIAPLRILQFISIPRYSLAVMLNNHYGTPQDGYIGDLLNGFPGIFSTILILIGFFIFLNIVSYYALKFKIRNKY